MRMRSARFTNLLFSPDVFKIIFLVMSILGVCPIVASLVEPYLKIFHLYAFVVILFDLFGEQRILKNMGRFLIILFGLGYVGTLLTNKNLINLSGLSNFVYLLIELAVVYSYGHNSQRIDRVSATVICTLISAANLIGIWMFFSKYCLYIPGRGYIGIFPYENRLAGMFGNPNVLGMICLGSICLSVIMFVYSNCISKKIYFALLGMVNVITLLLSNSRTQIYSVIFMSAVFVFMMTLKSKVCSRQFLRAALASVLTVVVVVAGFKTLQKGMSMFDSRYDYYLQNICLDEKKTTLSTEDKDPVAAPTETAPTDTQGKVEEQTIQRTATADLNGRLGLWISGVKVISARPLFGGGLDNHNSVLRSIGEEELPVNGNLHNVYLEVLASFGLVGFGCLIVFLLIMLQNVLVFFMHHEGNSWMLGAAYLGSVTAFLLDGLADSTLVASFYPTAVFFWYISSQFANLLEEENKRTGFYRKELLFVISEKMQNVIKGNR